MSSILISRKVNFSSGHRYWFSYLNEIENKNLLGTFSSPYNHGHNYVLEVTLKGSVNPKTGMIINITEVNKVLQEEVVQKFNNKSINDEIPEFKNSSPTVENLINYFWNLLENKFCLLFKGFASLYSIKLEETPTLYAEMKKQKISLTRVYDFAASHRLHSNLLTDQENLEIFGKCNHYTGHGHNYILEVSVTGEVDPKTQMIMSLEQLDNIVENEILKRYDHRNLNVDVEELKGQNPTSEVVALAIYTRLKKALPVKLVKVKLHETARNIFEVSEDE